jgi:hypothetical protein
MMAVAWALVFAVALSAVLLLNYWASFQPLSTLAYSGIGLALCGLANAAVPFQFLGVRKRRVGALVLASGVALAYAALYWPAAMIRVAQPKTRLDEVMPEYQFSERHSARVKAPPEQVMQAIRLSSFSDMKSLVTLLRVRSAVLGAPPQDIGHFQEKRILDAFAESGYLSAGSEREIALFGVWNARTNRRPDVHTLEQLVAYREHGAVKMGFGFEVEQSSEGRCTIHTETRVMILGDSRGPARYWRLIVPGSGLLRIQWLKGIKRRAENMPG